MAYTLNRRLAQLVDSNGQLNTGKIPNDYITSDHVADNTITTSMLHTSFTVAASNLTSIDTDDVSEGSSNLYYTDARVGTYISGNRTYGTISSGNITTTGYLAGPSTFTIDPAAVGDNTGTVVIAGNLQVDGTTTTINSTTMTVDDLNLTLASGAANSSAANGAGITIDGASASLVWEHAHDQFKFNKTIAADVNVASSSFLDDADIYALRLTNDDTTAGNTVGITFGQGGFDFTNFIASVRTGTGSNPKGDLVFGGRPSDGSTFVERMRIDSAGLVGIGTSTMRQKLHQHVTDSGANYHLFTNSTTGTGTTDGFLVGIDGDEKALLWNFENTGIKFATNNSQKMLINASGQVGIGTNHNPSHELDVAGNMSTTGELYLGTQNKKIAFNAGNSSSNKIGAWDYSSGSPVNPRAYIEFVGVDANQDTDIVFHTSTDATSVTEVMRVTENQKVGIGTSSPATLLDVSGTTPTITISDSQNKSWTSSDTIYGKVSFKTLDASGIGAHETAYIGVHADIASSTTPAGRLVFGTSNSNAVAAETMTLDGNGFLGIGTTNPSATLTVSNSGAEGLEFGPGVTNFGVANTNYIASYDRSANVYRDISFDVGGAEGNAIRFQTGGNVGIGIASPEERLHVVGQAVFENIGNTNRGNIIMGSHGSGTNKWATLAATHYNEATGSGNGSGNAGVMVIGSESAASYNKVWIGHGPYELNPATEIRLGTYSATTHNLGGNTRMTIASDGYISMTNSRSEYGLELSSASGRSGLVLKKPGTSSVMGSALLLASDETYRLGTASNYHIKMDQSGNTYFGNTTNNSYFNSSGNLLVEQAGGIFFKSATTYDTVYGVTNYSSAGYTGATQHYWHHLYSRGGTHITINTDGGVNASENTYDDFVIWQGTQDSGEPLFRVSNTGRVIAKQNYEIGDHKTNREEFGVNAINTIDEATSDINTTVTNTYENRSGVYWLNFNSKKFRAFVRPQWLQGRNWVLAAKFFAFNDMPSGSALWTNDASWNGGDFDLNNGHFSKYGKVWRYFGFNRLAMQMGDRIAPIMQFSSTQTLYGAFSGGYAANGGGVSPSSTDPALSTGATYHGMTNYMGPAFTDLGGQEDKMQSYGLNKWANVSSNSTSANNQGTYAKNAVVKGHQLTLEDSHPNVSGNDSLGRAGAWIGCPLDEGNGTPLSTSSNSGADSGFGFGGGCGNNARTWTSGIAEWNRGNEVANYLPGYIWLSVD